VAAARGSRSRERERERERERGWHAHEKGNSGRGSSAKRLGRVREERRRDPQVLDMRRATGGPLAVLSLQFRAEICHLRLKAPL